MPSLSDKEFQGFQQLIFKAAGITMSDAKKPLVSGRLAKRLAQHGLNTYGDYFKIVTQDSKERQMAVDLLTTNETFFFREPKHFEFLADAIAPEFARQAKLRLWCGASSTGEEPYTLAMTLAKALGPRKFEILASDISTRVLATAKKGLYPVEDAQDIPKPYRNEYCLKGVGSQAGWFTLEPAIRNSIQFDQINLNETLPDVGMFDVIFLRNVMIYFSADTKREVMARMLSKLRPGGYFVISHSESLHGVTSDLQMVKPSIYRKPA
ncbi:MAG: protein-glutamate O-methyltransferase CheR [Burkholderiales bacterium]|nr:protein-glutamate O-methyltransferase CheR [Burkholderiales bacterium]